MDLPLISGLSVLSGLSNIDMLILLGAGLVFLVMAYMIFKQIMKAIIAGAVSAAIPVVLYLLGFGIELNLQTIIWFALAGIAIYFVYDVISGWMKLMSIITWPIRRALRKKEPPKEAKKPEEQKDKRSESKKEGEEKAKAADE